MLVLIEWVYTHNPANGRWIFRYYKTKTIGKL